MPYVLYNAGTLQGLSRDCAGLTLNCRSAHRSYSRGLWKKKRRRILRGCGVNMMEPVLFGNAANVCNLSNVWCNQILHTLFYECDMNASFHALFQLYRSLHNLLLGYRQVQVYRSEGGAQLRERDLLSTRPTTNTTTTYTVTIKILRFMRAVSHLKCTPPHLQETFP